MKPSAPYILPSRSTIPQTSSDNNCNVSFNHSSSSIVVKKESSKEFIVIDDDDDDVVGSTNESSCVSEIAIKKELSDSPVNQFSTPSSEILVKLVTTDSITDKQCSDSSNNEVIETQAPLPDHISLSPQIDPRIKSLIDATSKYIDPYNERWGANNSLIFPVIEVLQEAEKDFNNLTISFTVEALELRKQEIIRIRNFYRETHTQLKTRIRAYIWEQVQMKWIDEQIKAIQTQNVQHTIQDNLRLDTTD